MTSVTETPDRKRLSALDTNYWRNANASGLPTPDEAAFYTPISAPVTPAEQAYYGSTFPGTKTTDVLSRSSPGSRSRPTSESHLLSPRAIQPPRPDHPSHNRFAAPMARIPETHTFYGGPSPIPSPPQIDKAESRKSRRLSSANPSPKSPVIQDSPRLSLYYKPRARILFYHKHDDHYGFTNFSGHPVVYQGKRYPTSEHLFQSFKFHGHRPGLAEHIRTCSERPSVAFSEARRFQPEVRPDWKQVNIERMDIALEHKFTQHIDLQQELLATGDAELVEDSDKDAFWGVGPDGKGRNELGKALERLRDKLRARL